MALLSIFAILSRVFCCCKNFRLKAQTPHFKRETSVTFRHERRSRACPFFPSYTRVVLLSIFPILSLFCYCKSFLLKPLTPHFKRETSVTFIDTSAARVFAHFFHPTLEWPCCLYFLYFHDRSVAVNDYLPYYT